MRNSRMIIKVSSTSDSLNTFLMVVVNCDKFKAVFLFLAGGWVGTISWRVDQNVM